MAFIEDFLVDINKVMVAGPCGMSADEVENLVDELRQHDELAERCAWLWLRDHEDYSPRSKTLRAMRLRMRMENCTVCGGVGSSAPAHTTACASCLKLELAEAEHGVVPFVGQHNAQMDIGRQGAFLPTKVMDAISEHGTECEDSTCDASDVPFLANGGQVVRFAEFNATNAAKTVEWNLEAQPLIDQDVILTTQPVSRVSISQTAPRRPRCSQITDVDKANATGLVFDLSEQCLNLDVTHSYESLLVWRVGSGIVREHNTKSARTLVRGDQIISVKERQGSMVVGRESQPRVMSALLREIHQRGNQVELAIVKREASFEMNIAEQEQAPELGVDCLITSDERVIVEKVRNGIIAKWSRYNPKQCLCVGDEITSVDGMNGIMLVDALNRWVKTHDRTVCISVTSEFAVAPLDASEHPSPNSCRSI